MIKYLIPLLVASLASCEKVTVLDKDNFDDIALDASKNVLVEFYAPWCGHCKNLAPVYEQVAAAFEKESTCVVANLDADNQDNKAISGKYGVSGYPTIKFFKAGSDKSGEDYSGGRDAQAFVDFLNDKCGTNVRLPRVIEDVVTLDSTNFNKVALDESKDVLVEFYAPWCGHCKSLAPVYEKVAATFKNEDNCVVAKVDADNADNKAISSKYGVSGFPTIKFFPKGSTEAEEYSAGRSEGDFISFLNEKCNTARIAGGGLSEKAGLLDYLSSYVSEFVAGDAETKATIRQTTIDSTKDEVPANKKCADYYAKVMAKTIEKGDSYPATELDRLTKMNGSQMKAAQADYLQKRKNILNLFVEAASGKKDEL